MKSNLKRVYDLEERRNKCHSRILLAGIQKRSLSKKHEYFSS